MSRLSSTLILSVLAYATMAHTPLDNPLRQETQNLAHLRAEDLGKSLEYFKETYPNIYLTHDVMGNRMTHFPYQGAYYYVWFVTEKDQEIAFRIKIDRTYPLSQADDVLLSIQNTYGRASNLKCANKNSLSEQCHHHWQTKNALSLDIFTHDNEDGKIHISSLTTNTVLSEKHHKNINALLPEKWQFSLNLE